MSIETAVKHTPGPWKIGGALNENRTGVNWEVPVWSDNGPEYGKMSAIATAPDREMARANARLIASAPDMLKALQSVLSDVQTSNGLHGLAPEIENAVEAAIRKAEDQR